MSDSDEILKLFKQRLNELDDSYTRAVNLKREEPMGSVLEAKWSTCRYISKELDRIEEEVKKAKD